MRPLSFVSSLWSCPPDLPRTLETEWRLVSMRWLGMLLMVPALRFINLSADQVNVAYGILAFAAIFNMFVQVMLRRRPSLFLNGYLTTICDGALSIGMISLAGGFRSSLYFISYTVTVSAAMRYGYRPTAALAGFYIVCDLLASHLASLPIDGAFLVRSGFLALTGMLGSHLRQQLWGAQTALQQQLSRAEHEAHHDRLTGLANRAMLTNRIGEATNRVSRDGGSLALMMVDLDRFKEVNDTLGHHYGDLLLVQVGARFVQALPPEATVARLGGDEFAILLPGAGAEMAAAAALELRSTLETLFTIEEYNLDVACSIGIATCPEHGTDARSLLRHADVAMYLAKRSDDPYALYTSDLDQHSPQRLAMVGELREAIEAGQLELHFQPKLSICDGSLVGAEALVRWPRPNGILVQPDLFVPVAEQTGLIRPLTRWVLDDALRRARRWLDAGLDVPVAVNLSMRDLHDSELPEVVRDMLARFDLPPTALLLEITESSLMVDPSRALATAEALSDIGVRLSIDDFGTGYSSLTYLRRLPVQELKIDRSFIGHMHDDEDAAIVRSVIGLAHDLGLAVVAEGVEDQTAWDTLALLGCDVAQGYYMSRPLPADEFLAWARTHGATVLAA